MRRFLRDCSGGVVVPGVVWTLVILVVGGLALDGTNAWRVRSQLRVTADAASLAAAMFVDDQDAARSAAIQVAAANMPPSQNGSVLDPGEIQFGEWDPVTRSFDSASTDVNAVRVVTRRSSARGNALRTHLLKLAGFESWDVSVAAIAMARTTEGGCSSATIMTSGYMDTGGGNTLLKGVCLHGETGVHTGGNDFYDSTVRISAADESTITINYTAPGGATAEEVKVEGSKQPKILPELNTMFASQFGPLFNSSDTTYSGDLFPDFVKGTGGQANIVRVNTGWWTIQPGDLQPNTIYLVNHGVQFAGGVDAHNVAIIANGQIGVGGGPALHFHDVYFFGAGDLNFSGDVMWGDQGTYCDSGRYNTYLFSKTSLSLGGFGSATGAYGVVGAAPQFSPGGAMKSSGGLYFEAYQNVALGGDLNISGCDEALEADFELNNAGAQVIAGSHLVQ